MDRGVGRYMRVQVFSATGDVEQVNDFREFSYLRHQRRQHIGSAIEKLLIGLAPRN